MDIQTNEMAINRLTKIIFRRAFALGGFISDNSKITESYNMMLNDIEAGLLPDDVKILVKALTHPTTNQQI